MTIHALIHSFLQQQTVLPLLENAGDMDGFTKAGMLPFIRKPGAALSYLVMKPVAHQPNLGAPPFQLCKGTRQHQADGIWRDIKGKSNPADKESLLQTALREGHEELGLRWETTSRIFDMGSFNFASARTGKLKTMWLFAAELKPDYSLLPDADIMATTSARAWMSAEEFARTGREDHRPILNDVNARLTRHFKEQIP